MATLEVRGLCAGYGRARVLFGVDLDVDAGQVIALLGRNGAGKSTTLRAVMGLLRPTDGTVRFAGREVGSWEPHEIARLGLGYVPEDRRIFTDLTVAENLEVGRRAPRPGLQPWTPERLFRLFPQLEPMRERPAARMSGGEQQMLTIARTLMGNPAALLLDEPSEGLAPKVVAQIAAAILEMKAQGLAVLLCEQSAAFAGRVADRGYRLEQGRVRRAGPVADLRENAFS